MKTTKIFEKLGDNERMASTLYRGMVNGDKYVYVRATEHFLVQTNSSEIGFVDSVCPNTDWTHRFNLPSWDGVVECADESRHIMWEQDGDGPCKSWGDCSFDCGALTNGEITTWMFELMYNDEGMVKNVVKSVA